MQTEAEALMHRMRYVVLHQQGMWNVVRGGCRYPGRFPEQTQAMSAAIDFARQDGRAGRQVEVLVRHEDGRYLTEWTPGCDLVQRHPGSAGSRRQHRAATGRRIRTNGAKER
jgi:hypothetical protein